MIPTHLFFRVARGGARKGEGEERRRGRTRKERGQDGTLE
jgi:hypothetical protein